MRFGERIWKKKKKMLVGYNLGSIGVEMSGNLRCEVNLLITPLLKGKVGSRILWFYIWFLLWEIMWFLINFYFSLILIMNESCINLFGVKFKYILIINVMHCDNWFW